MALPCGFEARLQEMRQTWQQRIQVLEEEKKLQKTKKLLLQEKTQELREIQHRRLVLKQETAGTYCKIIAKEDEIQAYKKKAKEFASKHRDLGLEVDELEKQSEINDEIYARTRSQMQQFDQAVEEHMSGLRLEVTKLQLVADKLDSELRQVKEEAVLSDMDVEIAVQERRRGELHARQEELARKAAESSLTSDHLRNELEMARRQQEENAEILSFDICMHKDERRVMELQLQSLEASISEMTHLGGQREKSALNSPSSEHNLDCRSDEHLPHRKAGQQKHVRRIKERMFLRLHTQNQRILFQLDANLLADNMALLPSAVASAFFRHSLS